LPAASDPSAKRSWFVGFREVANSKSLAVFASSLIVPLAAFMLYPFLIIYFTHVLHLGVAEAGLLLSVRFLASGLLGFLSGMLADRIGLARTYLIAGLTTGAALMALGLSRSLPVLALLLVVLGVSASTVNAMARGLVNDSVARESRGTAQTYVHWLNNVGMAAGLPLSGLLLDGGYSRLPFEIAAAAYVAMAVVLFAAFRREPPPRTEPLESSPARQSRVMPWTLLQDDRAFAWLLASFLLVVAVEMQFESGVPLDLSLHFSRGARLYGALGVLDMVVVVLLQLVVSHWLSQRRSPWYGYVGMCAVGGLIVGGLWQTVLGWTVSIMLLGVGDVFAYGQIFSLMGVLPRPGRQGRYFSVLAMVQGLATFVAYGLGAVLYQTLHAGWTFGLTLPVAVLATFAYRQAKARAPVLSEAAG
jgi:MFS family permease